MRTGDIAPDFTLPDEKGEDRTLSELVSSGPVVLFFYPVAMSGGCTVEACHFRDLSVDFANVGARPVGISTDPVDKQYQFADKNTLGYPLLSDEDGEVAELFDVRRSFGPLPTRRWTFVIDTDRTVIEVIKSEMRMSVHADRALEVLRERAQGEGTS
ncbi:peroxiredoxin [Natronoglycomyces albus]|uniref:thioredoxin-dependent peroxiredoxin n=1 Tax=Natronoglycomyces albus TaxID=2811108 RepID=A0A895XN39_9ACTN|nr:peroxiredoxin [Natronoglycomyces albus]QSB04943.1 peroxiredoxin [Natronoglycomyces albus]